MVLDKSHQPLEETSNLFMANFSTPWYAEVVLSDFQTKGL